MPSTLSHAFVAIAAEKAVVRKKPPFGFGLLTMGLAILPDLDTLGLRLGVPYGHFWGHRGMMHSLPFAFVVSFVASWMAGRWLRPIFRTWWRLWVFLLVIMALHPLLDAMTNGGLGVALFAPFDNTRYFLPWRPIQVSPIGLRYLFSRWGVRVAVSELLWVWLPLSAAAAGCRGALYAAARLRKHGGPDGGATP
jgi:inner membrane protein